jgi:hypothetical protein
LYHCDNITATITKASRESIISRISIIGKPGEAIAVSVLLSFLSLGERTSKQPLSKI